MVPGRVGHHIRFLRHPGLSAFTSEIIYNTHVSRTNLEDHCGGHIPKYE
jgi:hypothetical protein